MSALTNEERFIVEMGFEDSDRRTYNYIIYWLYLNWCLENFIRPVHKRHFFKTLSPLFKMNMDNGKRFYKLTCDRIKNMSKEEKQEAIYDHILQEDEQRRRKKNREKRKRQRKKLRTKEPIL